MVEFLSGHRSGPLRPVPIIQIGAGCRRGLTYAIHNIVIRCGTWKIARETSRTDLFSTSVFLAADKIVEHQNFVWANSSMGGRLVRVPQTAAVLQTEFQPACSSLA